MNYALVNLQGDVLRTEEFDDVPPTLAPEKGLRWIPDNRPAESPTIASIDRILPVPANATEIEYQVVDVEIATLRAAKKVEIEAARDGAAQYPVLVFGREWQAEPRHREMITQAITLAKAGLPLPPFWRDADNNNMAITDVQQLLDIAGAMSVQVNTAYAKSWTLKDAVDAAQTPADLAVIAW